MYKIESSKPPRSSIKSLIRKAIFNLYDIKATIAKDGSVSADFMKLSPMLKRIKQQTTIQTDDLLISIACGTILAALTVSFFI